MPTPNSVVLWKDLHEIAQKVSKKFGLRYGSILPETRKLVRYYGECSPCEKCYNSEHRDNRNCNEKILYIRVHQLNKPKVPLAASTILRILAHELAHLKVWDHGKAHRDFEKEIVEYIRGLGYEVKGYDVT